LEKETGYLKVVWPYDLPYPTFAGGKPKLMKSEVGDLN
jgi:hypothetical protein